LGENPDLLKAGLIHQAVDALAGSQLSRGVLLLDPRFSAALQNHSAFLAEIGYAGINGILRRFVHINWHTYTFHISPITVWPSQFT
jgi:hypothetical protein